MYCSNCGTVNPENALNCLKCGRDLKQPSKKEKTEVDLALAARPAGALHKSSPGTSTTRILFIVGIVAIVVMVPIGFMTMQLRTSMPVLTRADKPAVDQERGLGLAPTTEPEVIAGDVARKANASKARVALGRYFSEHGEYPDSLDRLDPQMLGFAPNPEVYAYQLLDDGHDFRLEVILRSNVVSGADIIKEGDLTKLVITGADY